jgi:Histidine kinase-, DNA gyrase B-, and HSP90-like ATPase
MPRHANFQVDPRLAMLLGETYRSSEQAIKELVDNAWDADANNVWITLPDPITLDTVRVRDDGTGMTEREVQSEYLKIARDRRATKGERTLAHHRLVKGRKGIGKFAGLIVADQMDLETRARGQLTKLTIRKDELVEGVGDLEKLPLAVESAPCQEDEHGTEIALSRLDQKLNFPDAERLKQLLVLEYGREDGFAIFVGATRVGIEDVPGIAYTAESDLPGIGAVILRLRIGEDQRSGKQSGIAIRVGGKIVGKPSFFGLESVEEIPRKLLRRVYGEVEADGLADDVTADWGGIIENSKGYAALVDYVQHVVKSQLHETFQREMNLAKARVQQDINRRLARMPEYRREFAHRAIERIMQKFYDEPEDRIRPIISVVLDALERDEYRQVLERIHEARTGDVALFAEALRDFGLVELGLIAQQSRYRLRLLDELDVLIFNPETTEQSVHTALAANLWILGPDFALMSSNRTLATIVRQYTDGHFTGKRATKRPDLLLLSALGQRYTLIEFKRPSHTIERQDVSQAEQYRDGLINKFQLIELWVIGKDFDPLLLLNINENVKLESYAHLINRARQELSWLLSELAGAGTESNKAELTEARKPE